MGRPLSSAPWLLTAESGSAVIERSGNECQTLAVTKGGVGIAAHLSCDVLIQASSAVQSGLKFGVVQLQGGNFFCKLGRAPAITAKSRLHSPPAPGGPRQGQHEVHSGPLLCPDCSRHF